MRKFIIAILFLVTGHYSNAVTFMVSVTNFQFTPSNIPNVVVGDIIQYNFVPLNNHNATSTPLGLVPAGAADIFSGTPGSVTTSYSYTVTKAGNYRYYCQVHSLDGITGMVGTFTASNAVPITLKSFNVVYSSGIVTAKWQTATEQNVSYFSLEKSTDGKNYNEAGRVPATGNSNIPQSYTFRDMNPDMNARYVYYMLKTVDNDGKYSLSGVKLVHNTGAVVKLITQIGPNPVSRQVGHLMFQFNSDRSMVMKALVRDASGKNIMNLDLNATRGVNNGHIHMGDLPTGMYTITFFLDGLKETRNIVVK